MKKTHAERMSLGQIIQSGSELWLLPTAKTFDGCLPWSQRLAWFSPPLKSHLSQSTFSLPRYLRTFNGRMKKHRCTPFSPTHLSFIRFSWTACWVLGEEDERMNVRLWRYTYVRFGAIVMCSRFGTVLMFLCSLRFITHMLCFCFSQSHDDSLS